MPLLFNILSKLLAGFFIGDTGVRLGTSLFGGESRGLTDLITGELTAKEKKQLEREVKAAERQSFFDAIQGAETSSILSGIEERSLERFVANRPSSLPSFATRGSRLLEHLDLDGLTVQDPGDQRIRSLLTEKDRKKLDEVVLEDAVSRLPRPPTSDELRRKLLGIAESPAAPQPAQPAAPQPVQPAAPQAAPQAPAQPGPQIQ